MGTVMMPLLLLMLLGRTIDLTTHNDGGSIYDDVHRDEETNMGPVMMPFLLSMLLGRTIDLTTYNVGGSIYDDDHYDEITINRLNSTYHVIQEEGFPYTFMGLPIDIVLRIKSKSMKTNSGSMGLEGLLKDTAKKSDSVLIAVATVAQTVHRSLKKDVPLLPNWQSRISESQTHYVNSLLYGGWNVIIFQFKCAIPGDVAIVRDTLTSALGIAGEIGRNTIDLWKRALEAINRNEEIRSQVLIYAHDYSTVPIKQDIQTPEDLLNVVTTFPEKVGKLGQPLFAELKSLHELDSRYPVVNENHELDAELGRIEAMLDDAQNTKAQMTQWLKNTLTVFEDKDETGIMMLLDHLTICIRQLLKVARDASVYKAMDEDDIKFAILLYNYGLKKDASTYGRLFRRIKEELDAECTNSFLYKVKGLLQVEDTERVTLGSVKGGLKECKEACLRNSKCRSIGYADHISTLQLVGFDTRTKYGTYTHIALEKQCWIYYRSTSTANIISHQGPNNAAVYDRLCL